jgi:hypothetical protein
VRGLLPRFMRKKSNPAASVMMNAALIAAAPAA